MHRVLIPIDTNEDRALAQVDYVKSLPNAAEAVEAYLVFLFTGHSNELPQEFDNFKSASRIDSVRRAQESLEEAGIEVTVLEDSGDTEDDILEEAEAYDVDSIVLGGRNRSPVGKAIFGSTTQGIILGSDRPVVVTGAKAK
ncbi:MULTISPECIES: universal stress protein [unclassified Natrinema]|uniref:universal stress protein n=1 Tax=unclassified Natrinema TaxID=2622230 RepID=UPI00026D4FD2|nr:MULTISPECIES: universal stress protein [unclassified Natrinema]AFO58069.1 UspA domain-containing protein [Natrinema sp. J7-2]